MQTTFPDCCCSTRQTGRRPAMRERNTASGRTLSWARLARLVEHTWPAVCLAVWAVATMVWSAATAALYATMLAAGRWAPFPVPLYRDAVAAGACSRSTMPVRFAFAEDQEQVDKLLEIAPAARSSRTSYSTTRGPARTTSRAWPRWTP